MWLITWLWLIGQFIHTSDGMNKNEFITPFERSKGKETATYAEAIDFYERLARRYNQIQVRTYGTTDVGKPLHVITISLDKNFNPANLRATGRRIVLINNAIHPGEPDGVDASMMLLRDIVQDKKRQALLQNTVLAVIPFYNVDGVLNRGKYSRANQNGPAEYGFRGNYRNLDLNRDFIKNDSRNARTFVEIFQDWQPDVYVETHVSNGADYQYTMTLIPTQEDKLGGTLGNYLKTKLVPKLESKMQARKFEMTPYVNALAETPDSGIVQFLETPRYSTGYAALFHTLAFMTETHMLKPYPQRVEATYQFLMSALEAVREDDQLIGQLRREAIRQASTQTKFPVSWQLNRQNYRRLVFKGYEASQIKSTFSGLNRLYYDRSKPFEKEIPFYNSYQPVVVVEKPNAYVIPQAWPEVIDRLRRNRVQMTLLDKDTTLTVTSYYLTDYKTSPRPFEGHYIHSQVQIRPETQLVQFYAGDFIINTDQEVNRYLVETLEPQATDSFFNWNFFDSVLGQKEGFSDYVFEDIAEQLLAEDSILRGQYNAKKQSDAEFRGNHAAQLDFIYRHSPYYERSHLRYPVFRLEK